MMRLRKGTAVALLMILPGCTVGPTYRRPAQAPRATFGEVENVASSGSPATQPSRLTSSSPVAAWWHSFHDPELDRLIAGALQGNQDLQIATARIREARAQRGITAADLFPEIDATGAYNHALGSQNVQLPLGGGGGASGGGAGSATVRPAAQASGGTADPPGDPPAGGAAGPVDPGGNPIGHPLSPLGAGGLPGVSTDLFQAGFDASWELDVFGGTRRRVEAATDDLQAAVEGRRDVLVTLLAEVARNYVELRGTQARLAVARQNLQAASQILELTRAQQKSGLTTQLDVARAAGQVAQSASLIPPLQTQERVSMHALATLLGEDPNALTGELAPAAPVPPLPPEVPVGLPSELLRRRPDVRQAERQLAAATARVGAATADLFPKFGLTGSTGLDATEFSHLFDWDSHYFVISPSVTWPVFDAGRIVSNISLQKANTSEAVLQYRKAVLKALREVEDALVAYSAEQVRHAAVAEALRQDQEALRLAQDQYRNGLSPFLNVLDAERTVFVAQDVVSQSDETMTANLVALYKALGGGWDAVDQ